jgi:hypothetical protein
MRLPIPDSGEPLKPMIAAAKMQKTNVQSASSKNIREQIASVACAFIT